MKKQFNSHQKSFHKHSGDYSNRYPRKKKAFGQHFLRKQSVVDHMIQQVAVSAETSVLEIGCGDGFLTQSILSQTPCKKLVVYEIDHEWARVVRENIADHRLEIREQNVLDVDLNVLLESEVSSLDAQTTGNWVLLANLPYQITFPILFLLQKHRGIFSEGVVMVQEEVAQKMVATHGKPYSATTMFLQRYFKFELMEKVEPGAFVPPPKVHSRLVYFKPRFDQQPIKNEEDFWKFLKLCFKSPRQTLKNNLRQTHYNCSVLSDSQLQLRAQQMTFQEFLEFWDKIS